ncbi:MAG: A24 family peptidase [Elusimicrobiota bacterium]|jgi:leader peptidase (prepilin peptidase)/N-methyltransferase|nr:A24 family peptidase [Elusimicrobiota bacterium]
MIDEVFSAYFVLIVGFIVFFAANISISKISKQTASLSGEIIYLSRSNKVLLFLVSQSASFVLFYYYGFSLTYFILLALLFSLIVVTVIDYNYRIVPNIFPALLILCGLLLCAFNEVLGYSLFERFLNSIAGIICGGVLLFIFEFIGRIIYKQDVLGGGDIKLMASIGSIIGFNKILIAIFTGFLLGAVIGFFLIILKKADRKGYMPFVPFLAAGTYISLFCPNISFFVL